MAAFGTNDLTTVILRALRSGIRIAPGVTLHCLADGGGVRPAIGRSADGVDHAAGMCYSAAVTGHARRDRDAWK
jgi:hypothetical protein